MSETHIVKQGECLSEIARKHGFARAEDLYQHADNKPLRDKNKDPNVLCPGDKVVIPDKKSRQENVETDQKHRFGVKNTTKVLKLKLHDHRSDTRFADRSYTLTVHHAGGSCDYQGTLDGEGVLEQEIHLAAREGLLKIQLNEDGGAASEQHPDQTPNPRELELKLMIDHLDPAEEVSGQQARLVNLGFDCGPIDGVMGPRTGSALSAFQYRHGLTVSGSADANTCDALRKYHGS